MSHHILSWAESQQGVLSRRFTVRLRAAVPIMAISSKVERQTYILLTKDRYLHRRPRFLTQWLECFLYTEEVVGSNPTEATNIAGERNGNSVVSYAAELGSTPSPATTMHGYKVQMALIRLSRWERYPYVRPDSVVKWISFLPSKQRF